MHARNHVPITRGETNVPPTSILASCTPKTGAGSIWGSSELQVILICFDAKGGDLQRSPVESTRSTGTCCNIWALQTTSKVPESSSITNKRAPGTAPGVGARRFKPFQCNEVSQNQINKRDLDNMSPMLLEVALPTHSACSCSSVAGSLYSGHNGWRM